MLPSVPQMPARQLLIGLCGATAAGCEEAGILSRIGHACHIDCGGLAITGNARIPCRGALVRTVAAPPCRKRRRRRAPGDCTPELARPGRRRDLAAARAAAEEMADQLQSLASANPLSVASHGRGSLAPRGSSLRKALARKESGVPSWLRRQAIRNGRPPPRRRRFSAAASAAA